MENKKRKRRILTTALSACLCLLLIGVSVWAATQQSATVNNSIKITAANDVQCSLTVSGQSGGTAIFDKDTLPVDEYTELLTLTKNDYDGATGAGPDIVFCEQAPGGYYYYVYKFDFNNKSKVINADYTISIVEAGGTDPYEFDSQVDIFYGKEAAFDGTLTPLVFNVGYTGMSGTIACDATDGDNPETVYMVVAINKSLFDVEEVEIAHFDINVTMSVNND